MAIPWKRGVSLGCACMFMAAMDVKAQSTGPTISVVAQPDDADVVVADRLQRAFQRNQDLFRSPFHVQVNHAHVVLKGQVDTLRERTAALHLARETQGVMNVDNQLVVRHRPDTTDQALKTTLTRTLQRSPHLDHSAVRVGVKRGHAVFRGEVRCEFHKQLAEDLVAGIPGVAGIDNRVTIQGDVPVEEDGRLTQRVRRRLRANPWVDGKRIDVTVRDGVATLKGTVASPMEWMVATDIAGHSGVKDVDNLLVVQRNAAR